jgi:MFS family permease
MGGLTTSTKFLNVFGNPDSALLGFIVASYEVGALLGALFQFALGDRYGRKTNNLGGAVLVVIGAILQASTTTLAQFLIGRIVGGFDLGCMTTVIPIWLTECATRANRGWSPCPSFHSH